MDPYRASWREVKLSWLLAFNRLLGKWGQNAFVSKQKVIAHICRYQSLYKDRQLFVRELEQLKEDIENE